MASGPDDIEELAESEIADLSRKTRTTPVYEDLTKYMKGTSDHSFPLAHAKAFDTGDGRRVIAFSTTDEQDALPDLALTFVWSAGEIVYATAETHGEEEPTRLVVPVAFDGGDETDRLGSKPSVERSEDHEFVVYTIDQG